MYVLHVSNPALAAKSNKPLLFTAGLCVKALSGDGVNFVNEDDGRRVLLGQTEHIADHPWAFPEILLNKLGADHTNERRWKHQTQTINANSTTGDH